MTPSMQLLEAVTRAAREATGLIPVMAVEFEFYLHGNGDIAGFTALMERAMREHGIATFPLEKERGNAQYEYAVKHLPDPVKIARDTETLKRLIVENAVKSLFEPDFRAKPIQIEPGSGVHVHVSLIDGQGRNHFFREGKEYSPLLVNAVGGMLHHLPASMVHFAPYAESYARFAKNGFNVPTTISWGANNRTVAVRLPDGPAEDKHIEHRVTGADADIAEAMAAVLAAAVDGIARSLTPNEKMYGNAHEEKYQRPPLPGSLEEARALAGGSPLMAYHSMVG
ncbi:MAG: hypothetical protein J0L97_08420 [Alphaproteobacteria bacterium]|nr:hypothetical protein [Alphaproteobacteria bacterium]